MFPVVGYFKALSILAQASATLLLGASMPGNVAQPPFAMNVSCCHESVALSSAKVALAAVACWKFDADWREHRHNCIFGTLLRRFRGRTSERPSTPSEADDDCCEKARDGSLYETG